MREERLHAQPRTSVSTDHDSILEEYDISEAHSATDEAWHWLKPGSSTLGKEFQVSYELN